MMSRENDQETNPPFDPFTAMMSGENDQETNPPFDPFAAMMSRENEGAEACFSQSGRSGPLL